MKIGSWWLCMFLFCLHGWKPGSWFVPNLSKLQFTLLACFNFHLKFILTGTTTLQLFFFISECFWLYSTCHHIANPFHTALMIELSSWVYWVSLLHPSPASTRIKTSWECTQSTTTSKLWLNFSFSNNPQSWLGLNFQFWFGMLDRDPACNIQRRMESRHQARSR